MRKLLILALLVFAIVVGLFIQHVIALQNDPLYGRNTQNIPTGLSADKLFSLVNQYRNKIGKNEFTKDKRLCDIAQERANQLVLDFTHDAFANKYDSYPYVLSENIVRADSEDIALNAWLGSVAHKNALEANWKYSCIACMKNSCSEIFSNL